MARDLRAVYGANTLAEAEDALTRFAEKRAAKHPAISPSWRADWYRLTVFFDYSPEIRKEIYTTNGIESLNYSLRKLLKTRSYFPKDDSIVEVLYLAINRAAKKWTMPIKKPEGLTESICHSVWRQIAGLEIVLHIICPPQCHINHAEGTCSRPINPSPTH